MAKVILRNNWFAPSSAGKLSGRRFRKSEDGWPRDIPNSLLKFLPKSAVIVGEDYLPPAEAAEREQEARDLDAYRQDSDAVANRLKQIGGESDDDYNPHSQPSATEKAADEAKAKRLELQKQLAAEKAPTVGPRRRASAAA